MKLMADDDEVFEVTAISEQLDLGRKICTHKKCLMDDDSRSNEGEYVFDGLQLLLVSFASK